MYYKLKSTKVFSSVVAPHVPSRMFCTAPKHSYAIINRECTTVSNTQQYTDPYNFYGIT